MDVIEILIHNLDFYESVKFYNQIIYQEKTALPSISFLIRFFVDPDSKHQSVYEMSQPSS
jgi:hypothetical protein